ncbi:6-phosphogluconolactonase [Aquamicrobium sp. LC103]|uniref:6-phosphogluconolactonase n=1 Tax=Aquamicrobium sp. LC103 TaxID=1120658 RepID=UPI00063E8BB8|nr:6-phosphogluconolactonase [Aquamicrobium sp. LC103]TKT74155.1 6-phosphogluconolactonase [Aquamicrobium sp. LC103]
MRVQADWNEFSSSEALAEALADRVASLLAAAIEKRGSAFLAVSGGSTPGRFFRSLSTRGIDWRRCTVTLVDERFVPESSPRSNAALVKSALLRNEAAKARFVPLYDVAETAEEAAAGAAAQLGELPWPLDVAVLGMGADGHTASFFPDAANLPDLLSPRQETMVLPVQAPSAGEPRLTLPLAAITKAGFVALHIEGEEKRQVLETVLEGGADLPVGAVFKHSNTPVQIYWAK